MNSSTDTLPQIAAIDRSSAAFRVGLMVGDRVMSVNGVVPRDILEWQRLVESDDVDVSGRMRSLVHSNRPYHNTPRLRWMHSRDFPD